MDSTISLFPQTILSMKDKLHELRKKFKLTGDEDPTGASSRLLDPNRVSLFESICTLENLLAKTRILDKPDQNNSVQIGHTVTIVSQDNKELHLCSALDVKYLVDKNQLDGRLLSVDCPLGVLIIGKSVGDEIRHGQQRFRIIEIKVSEYLGIIASYD